MLSFESDMHIVQCIILNMPSRGTHQPLAIKRNWRQLGSAILFFLLVIILLTLNSYSYQKEFKRSFVAWGTNLDFVILSDLNEKHVNKAILEAQKIALDKNAIFNNYDSNSEISKFNLLDSNIERKISGDFLELFKISMRYNQISDGYFDITLGRITKNIDYKEGGELDSTRTKVANILKECSGFDKIIFDPYKQSLTKRVGCLELDFGGIAEGYVIGLMVKKLTDNKIKDALINFGGNITTISTNHKWEIDIKEPGSHETVYKSYNLNNMSVSTSGRSLKNIEVDGELMSHIINPLENTLKAKKDISISVFSKDSTYADAMSTALLAMPLDMAIKKLNNLDDLNALILVKDNLGNIEVVFQNIQSN
ncbi:MAG: hypothetical protein CMN79_03770 [Spirochaetales bacterium]|nr:hypothetical protein [Spirochaetales bacterium]